MTQIVKDNPQFLKDPSTHAIIHGDKKEYDEFIRKSKERKNAQKRIDDMEKKINSLESKLDDILNILMKEQ
tara:strand:+ start:203 stop:415 length:213 start_codon:yes stop_codon:yes gene_type:complete